jgi:transcriptional repressor NrdR
MIRCPYCREDWNDVKNSRPTKDGDQIWRRRICRKCGKTFTTYEKVTPTITVIKRDGKKERYNRFNIYTSIYRAAFSWPKKEEIIDRITDRVEASILDLGKKEVTTEEIAELVMRRLRARNLNTFLRYLTYSKRPKTEQEFQRLLRKLLPLSKKR